MNELRFLFPLAVSLLSSSCMTISTGNGPHGTKEDLQHLPATVKRNVTFSVDFKNDIGTPDNLLATPENITKDIREHFKNSGMFDRVHYVPLSHASSYHLHFQIGRSGTPRDTSEALGYVMGFSLFCIPVWNNYTYDWSMSVLSNRREVASFSSQQQGTDIAWLPFAIATPFCNYLTVGPRIRDKAIFYFLKELKQNDFNRRLK